MAAFYGCVRLRRIAEEIPGLKRHRERSVVEPRRQPDQAGAAFLAVIRLKADIPWAREFGVDRRSDHRAIARRSRGTLQGGLDGRQHLLHATGGELAHLQRPVRVGVIDDLGRAKLVYELVVARARSGDHIRPEIMGDLDREVAKAAGSSGDQSRFTFADVEHVSEALLGGDRIDRRGRRVHERQPDWDGGKLLYRARHVLRVTAAQSRIAVDRRAVVKGRAGAGIALDDTRELTARYVRH